MTDPLLLLLQASLVAGIVIAITMTAERSGPFWGALIASLPVSIGTIYVVMATELPASFISRGLLSSLATNASTTCFLVTAALAATRTGPVAAVALAIAAWIAATTLIHQIDWPVWGAVALNAATLTIALIVLRLWARPGMASSAPRRWFDLPLRALLVGLLMIFITLTSKALGPEISGIMAIVPVVFISATIVMLNRLGGPATAATLSRAVVPIAGFGLALLVAHLATARLGSPVGLALGLATSLGFSGFLAIWHLRGARRRHN
jgi:hypothetical protein